jgi:hypothetical protein
MSFWLQSLYPQRSVDRKLGGPTAGLNAVAKRKILVPAGNRTPVVQTYFTRPQRKLS